MDEQSIVEKNIKYRKKKFVNCKGEYQHGEYHSLINHILGLYEYSIVDHKYCNDILKNHLQIIAKMKL